MNNTILIGQYWETNSLFHRLDPRTKIVSIVLLMLSFISLESFISYTIATLFVAVIIQISKIPVRVMMGGLKPILFILLFTLLYQALFTKGNVVWSWSFLEITLEGLKSGLRLVWRIILLILLASLLTYTTKPLDLAHGLEKLLSPLTKLHIPVEQFSLMIVIAIRFIPTILQELDRILLAQRARGYDIKAFSAPKRIFAYIPILVPLLFTIIGRAEQLSFAVEARAYGKGKGRTSYKTLKFQAVDYQAGVVVMLMTVMLFVVTIVSD
ncbi:energy-coupling factor transporter transmembrane component T family protein [Paenibacillus dakarensis]|uniref:energy-coupling factor transporter transmembrane component T family protein n=1 Tax=Paenibacillus dakarensis TaxID=1527293 RepID=UPI0006D5668C|nr:energy-coupling factor transporter transmembrane protein EcfT [Paenibacillus dakarensis]